MHGDAPGGPIRWRLHLAVPPARVYAALDSDAGRAAFWAEQAVEREGAIEFRFSNGVSCRCPLRQREPPRRWALDYFGSPLLIELDDDGRGGTDLRLCHEGVAAGEWHEVHAGWLNVLLPLKAWLQFGVDLRNHDPQRSWDQGYADH